MEKLIQLQTEQVLLTYLLASGIDDNLSFASKGVVQKALAGLKKYVEAQQKVNKDETLAAHYFLMQERMEVPEKAKPTIHAAIPQGSPIGCDWVD